MIEATLLKNGTTFLMNDKPYKVEKYTHSKIGRGGANVKLILRNLTNGEQKEITVNSNVKFKEIDTLKKKLQFLYFEGDMAIFMDPKSFDQFEIPTKIAKNEKIYFSEGENVNIVFWGNNPLSIEISAKVNLVVIDTPPGVKGNSASNVYKDAKLKNGSVVKVPLFVKNGDTVRIDTKTGNYVERIKN